MIAAWMLHALVVSALLGAGAVLAEKGLRAVGGPTRWVWMGALVLTAVLPLLAPTISPRSPALPSGSPTLPGSPGAASVEGPPLTAAEETLHPGSFVLPAEDVEMVIARPPVGERDAISEAGADPWSALSSFLGRWNLGALVLGALAGMAWIGALALGTARIRRERRAWRSGRVEGRSVLLSRRTGPAVVGVRRPAIVLPAWVLTLDRHLTRLVVRHESEHLEARDTLVLGFAGALLTLLAWNPLAWWQAYRLRAAVEIDCDRRVLSQGADPDEYGRLLVQVGRRRARLGMVAAAMAEPPNLLERRLEMMMRFGGGRRWIPGIAAAGTATILFALACALPVPRPAEPVEPPAPPMTAEADPTPPQRPVVGVTPPAPRPDQAPLPPISQAPPIPPVSRVPPSPPVSRVSPLPEAMSVPVVPPLPDVAEAPQVVGVGPVPFRVSKAPVAEIPLADAPPIPAVAPPEAPFRVSKVPLAELPVPAPIVPIVPEALPPGAIAPPPPPLPDTAAVATGDGPLVIVDGVVLGTLTDAIWRRIRQYDILDIEVLSPEEAVAIYGERASDGVISITTREGRSEGAIAGQAIERGGVIVLRGDSVVVGEGGVSARGRVILLRGDSLLVEEGDVIGRMGGGVILRGGMVMDETGAIILRGDTLRIPSGGLILRGDTLRGGGVAGTERLRPDEVDAGAFLAGLASEPDETSPLVIVDGVILGSAARAGIGRTLNASDIVNVEVLSGRNAATLYGSRAANGVISITTKRGPGG